MPRLHALLPTACADCDARLFPCPSCGVPVCNCPSAHANIRRRHHYRGQRVAPFQAEAEYPLRDDGRTDWTAVFREGQEGMRR
jgi:hypothetical protein